MFPPITAAPEFIKLMAHDLRWGLLQALAISDHQVKELVERLNQPMNLVSYHLKRMRDEALVTTRRSECDARDVYYSLDLDQLRQRFLAAGIALHPSLHQATDAIEMSKLAHRRILFVCTHNSARSQMAQALLNYQSSGKLTVLSAGSHPTRVHPDAITTMQTLKIDISNHATSALHDLIDQPFDYVITVCDKAREVCPTFPGQGAQIHWGLPDPVAIDNPQARLAAFERTAQQLRTRIRHFLTVLNTPAQ